MTRANVMGGVKTKTFEFLKLREAIKYLPSKMALASPCGAAGVTITHAAREAHQRAGTLAAQNILWLKKKKIMQ